MKRLTPEKEGLRNKGGVSGRLGYSRRVRGGGEFSRIKGRVQAFINYNFFVHKISHMQIVHAKAF